MFRHTLLLLLCLLITVVAKSWETSYPGYHEPISYAVSEDGQICFVAMVHQGLWKSSDHGQTWIPLTEGIPGDLPLSISKIIPVDQDLDTIIVYGDDYLIEGVPFFYSYDGGNSFQQVSITSTWPFNHHMSVSHHNRHHWYHINAFTGFSKSLDAGQTWETTLIDSITSDYYFIEEDAIDPDRLFVGRLYHYDTETEYELGGVLESIDGGESWHIYYPLYNWLGTTSAQITAMEQLSNGETMLSVWNGSGGDGLDWDSAGVVIVSEDESSAQRFGYDLPTAFHPSAIREDSQNPGTVYLRGEYLWGVYRSDDYGRTWQKETNGFPDIPTACEDLSFQHDVLYASLRYDRVYSKESLAGAWNPVPIPQLAEPHAMYRMESNYYVNNARLFVYKLTDPMGEWEPIPRCTQQDALTEIVQLFWDRGDTLAGLFRIHPFQAPPEALNYLSLAVSGDAGDTWMERPMPTDFISHMATEHNGEYGQMVFATGRNALHVSHDFMETWTSYPYTVSPGPSAKYFRVFPRESFAILAVTDTDYFKFDYETETMTALEYPGERVDSKSWATVFQENSMYVLDPTRNYLYGYWYRYDFDTETWTNLAQWPCEQIFGFDRMPDGRFVFGYWDAIHYDGPSLFVTADEGESFEEVPVDLGHPGYPPRIRSVLVDEEEGLIWITTDIGVAYAPLEVLDVPEIGWNTLPFSEKMVGNYPNPFNHVTTVTVEVPRTAPLRVEVMNVEGRTVDVLWDGRHPAGRFRAPWNASSYASGVYFLRTTYEEQIHTRRMIMVK